MYDDEFENEMIGEIFNRDFDDLQDDEDAIITDSDYDEDEDMFGYRKY